MSYNRISDNMVKKTNAVLLVMQSGTVCTEAFYEFEENDLNGNYTAATQRVSRAGLCGL